MNEKKETYQHTQEVQTTKSIFNVNTFTACSCPFGCSISCCIVHISSHNIWQSKSLSLHFYWIFDSIENYPLFMYVIPDLDAFGVRWSFFFYPIFFFSCTQYSHNVKIVMFINCASQINSGSVGILCFMHLLYLFNPHPYPHSLVISYKLILAVPTVEPAMTV